MYTSVNVKTGLPIHDLDHFIQCATDIVTTAIGTRVMRRQYGSKVSDLVDSPDNASTRLRFISAAATALMRWDDRLTLSRVQVASVGQTAESMGQVQFAIDGIVTIGNERYVLEGALLG